MKVAQHLSEVFASLGLSPVMRIPVLGRTGPDLQINEFGLVIDVKSRLEVPIRYMTNCFSEFGDLIGAPLNLLKSAAAHGDDGSFLLTPLTLRVQPCKTVDDYYAHMKQWVVKEYPSGIAALVLHRPKMPIGEAMLIISNSDRKEFTRRWSTPKSLHISLPSQLFSTAP